MINIREATEAEAAAWQEDWCRRLTAWYRRSGAAESKVREQVTFRLDRRATASEAWVGTLVADERPAGSVAVALVEAGARVGVLDDVRVAPPHRRAGYASAARDWAEGWCRERARQLVATTDPTDPAQAALFGRYPVLNRWMVKTIATAAPVPDGVAIRPMTPAEFPEWRAGQVRSIAADTAELGLQPSDGPAAYYQRQFAELLPDGAATRGHTLACLEVAGVRVASIWLHHQHSPATSWVYNVEVSPAHRGKGYGRAAMAYGECATLAAGDTRLGLNVFARNLPATGLYRSLGYLTVDERRSADL